MANQTPGRLPNLGRAMNVRTEKMDNESDDESYQFSFRNGDSPSTESEDETDEDSDSSYLDNTVQFSDQGGEKPHTPVNLGCLPDLGGESDVSLQSYAESEEEEWNKMYSKLYHPDGSLAPPEDCRTAARIFSASDWYEKRNKNCTTDAKRLNRAIIRQVGESLVKNRATVLTPYFAQYIEMRKKISTARRALCPFYRTEMMEIRFKS